MNTNNVEVKLDCDFSVIHVNGHKAKKVMYDEDIQYIKKIFDVWAVCKIGSYGMELFVICDQDSENSTVKAIFEYFNH